MPSTNPSKTILLTGGTGLVGSQLSKQLEAKGHQVRILTQQKNKADQKKYFYWNWKNHELDLQALQNIDAIIHLAGRNISEGFWTSKNKQEIIDSRVQSLAFLQAQFAQANKTVDVFISASGTGYYGFEKQTEPCIETQKPGHDFLAKTCIVWEKAAHDFSNQSKRLVVLRTGVVLSKKGGMLSILEKLTRLYAAQVVGSGQQIIPWIHIDDLCALYVQALENPSYHGIYNAVGGNTSQKEFTFTLAKQLKKPVLLPNLPLWFLRLVLGEKSVLLTHGVSISNQKACDAGFGFEHQNLALCLKSIFLPK